MVRKFVLVAALLLSTLACSLFGTITQTPTLAPVKTNTQAIGVTLSQPPSTSAPIGTQPPKTTATTKPATEEPTPTLYPTSVLDPQLSSEINLIQSQVIEERGLQPKNPVSFVLLNTDQLRQNVITDYNADNTDEDTHDQVLGLSIVGLLPPNYDLRSEDINIQSEQIAGYYDEQTKEMFVVQGAGFNGEERLTYSHEYTHVLQDQNFDIEHGLNYNDDACEVDSERCAGIQALLEGDAVVSESIWQAYYATAQDKQQIDDFLSKLKTPIFDSAPAYMRDDLLFPYNQGGTFVLHFFEQGGWTAVDAVYHNPPVSTEQILHPDLYPSDTPVSVEMPDVASTLGQGWREVSRDQMGEWFTYLILARGDDANARLSDSDAQAAAAGWGGDTYLVLHNDATDSTAFVMKTVWDTTNDASEFASSFQTYANARFGVNASQQGDTSIWIYSGGYSSLQLSGNTTIWIITPDSATAQIVAGLVLP